MYMFKYILKRIGLMIMTFVVIMIICFTLIKLLPLPDDRTFGQDANIIKMQREAMGYGKPILVQFWMYLKNIFVYGNFGVGEQMYVGQPVWDVFVSKLPPTILINFYSSIFSIPIGIALGIYAALRKNKWQDHVVSTGVMVVVSVPSYIYAFLVQYIFSFKLKWFPFLMEASTDYLSWAVFYSLIPAIACMSFGSIAGYCRGVRAELTEVLTSEFMLLARTKGLTKGQATVRHALRNAMVPFSPMVIGEIVGLLSGSIIIEKIFGIPGSGNLYITSINAQDYNFFMMLSAFYTLIGLAAAIIGDISYGIIDPRIRMGAR